MLLAGLIHHKLNVLFLILQCRSEQPVDKILKWDHLVHHSSQTFINILTKHICLPDLIIAINIVK